MSKFSAILLASLVSLSVWSESPSRGERGPSTPPPAPKAQASILFQDPMLGTVKMHPVYTPSSRFGNAGPVNSTAVALQRLGVSVDQTKTVRPGSWR